MDAKTTEIATLLTDLSKQLRGEAWPAKIVRVLGLLHEHVQAHSLDEFLQHKIAAAEEPTALVDALGRLASAIDSDTNARLNVACVEAEHSRPAAPSRWARVHMLGHQEHVGEVTLLGGGAVLIHALKDDLTRSFITTERQGRHSIEWLTETQWTEFVANTEAAHALEVQREQRRHTFPPGYEPYTRQLGDPESNRGSDGFVAPDGQVWGWWYHVNYARAAAWSHADGDMEDVDGYARFPRISNAGVDNSDVNDPRSAAYIEQTVASHRAADATATETKVVDDLAAEASGRNAASDT